MKKKLLEFQANISDVVQVNPLFSTCKVRVLYTGKNRNLTIFTKDSVENALPSLKNIPIVGEFSESTEDFKGHGGAIDLSDFRFIHTTKAYGVVPESATYEWEEINGREYLSINGCYLWTGRYDEAQTVIENGKSQSMEIEVVDGKWIESEEAYQIDNFIFSALCILGDDVEPAFEDANITAYSLDKDSFKQEFSQMLKELKFSLSHKKEVEALDKLLKKYSITIEDLKTKGIDFENLSENVLEEKIKESFEVETPVIDTNEEVKEEVLTEQNEQKESEESPIDEAEEKEPQKPKVEVDFEARVAELESELKTAIETIETQNVELESLRSFKLDAEKANHELKAKEIFNKFQLKEEDVEVLDIHSYSLQDIEEKCYAILGRKLAANKNFTKIEKDKDGGIRLPIIGNEETKKQTDPYGDLFEKFNRSKK